MGLRDIAIFINIMQHLAMLNESFQDQNKWVNNLEKIGINLQINLTYFKRELIVLISFNVWKIYNSVW